MPWRVVAGTPCARALERVRADPLTPYPHRQRAPLSGRSGDRHTPRPSCRARPRGAHRAQSAPCPGGWCDRDPWTAPSSPGDFSQTGPGPHAAPRRGGCLLSARRTACPGGLGRRRGSQASPQPFGSGRIAGRTRPGVPGQGTALGDSAAHASVQGAGSPLGPVQEACEPGRCGWRVPAVAAASARRVAGAVVSPCAPVASSPHKRLSAERPQPETGPRPERRCCGASFPWAHARPL